MAEKVALVTGSSRGIGAACARALAEQGYHLCINYVASQDKALALVEELASDKRRVIAVRADVSDEVQVEGLFRTIDDELGSLTALVNNAGILMQQERVMSMDAARINRMMAMNVTSAFLCCREAVRRMSTACGGAGGAIVNVSSAAARLGGANEYVDYAASKGALDTLTRGLALEVAKEGIRVNAVRPGFIDTEIHADGGEPDRIARVTPLIPLGRGGTAEEVAAGVTWLLSEQASYVTGAFLDLAGGR